MVYDASDFPAVRTPIPVIVAVAGGIVCSVVMIATALANQPGIIDLLVVTLVPGAAVVRAVADGPAGKAKVVEVIACLFGLLWLWMRPDVGTVLVVALLLFPVLGGEVYRWFRRQKQGRVRWLSLHRAAADDGARIVWVQHASPRGEQTQVLLMDPSTGEETTPRSLWGQWPAQIYVAITGGRRVLAMSLRGDDKAAERLAKYEVA
ncbi:hypothetical protein [Nocardia puris]|uniref:Uncharacterized protein n=1 Tax=Nocardia puris TaxID=208602 RepID=A0A366D0V1_9NOCA|nr:hypothetical protein [Nocardia puris]RBO83084.1 hypothetical protein DFR74_1196 [Nocardia puris]